MRNDVKKHWFFKLIVILFLIILFLIIPFVSFKFILTLDSPSIFLANMYNLSGLFITIIALLNLYLVYFFYNENNKSKMKELKIQSKLYWYRTIVIEKNMTLLEDFFQNSLDTITSCKELFCSVENYSFDEINEKAKKLIANYTDLKMNVDKNLTDMIKVVDSNFGNEIDKIIMNFQDEFTKSISEAMFKRKDYNYTTIEDLISRQKRTLYSALYSYEIGDCIDL